jgi:hypothetical protein
MGIICISAGRFTEALSCENFHSIGHWLGSICPECGEARRPCVAQVVVDEKETHGIFGSTRITRTPRLEFKRWITKEE